jgi:hypothetical protein
MSGTSRRIPTPEEWAVEQLENAPARSPEWAQRVARIYGLDASSQEDTVTAGEWDAVRRAGASDARRSRAGQGLPERVEDPAAVAELAAMLRDRPRPRDRTRHPDQVTGRFRAGISLDSARIVASLLPEGPADPDRCGMCGYLVAASGHTVTCGQGNADRRQPGRSP